MKDHIAIPAQSALRPPSQVMRLARMGAMFPTRLSFIRVLLRHLARERAQLRRSVWSIDANGFGHAVYTTALGGHNYSLVAVSNDLPDHLRTDRVIATAWDTAYVLFDGIPDASDIARICAQAPLQEAGRFTERDLVLSRANKSVRLFSHVVDRLRAGQQPDAALIRDIGYLMRTTAVYGNGKFGIADRALIADRPGMDGSFAAEMLTVWMIRNFTHDLVEHLGGHPLDRGLKRHLGIGNSTGLGMAPFLVAHPTLLNNWMIARETAIARVRAVPEMVPNERKQLRKLAERATKHLSEWNVPSAQHQARITALRADWATFVGWLDQKALSADRPLDALMRRAADLGPEAQELAAALILEPFGPLIDGLADCMSDPFGPTLAPVDDTGDLKDIISEHFVWALEIDFDDPDQQHQFWYVSEEKQEPRLGHRHSEPGADRESPLDIARRVAALFEALPSTPHPLQPFRAAHPEHELALRRVLAVPCHPYGEIRDNLIAQTCLPIDMLRCKLSFFGASKFDPKSDRWTRITLAQGAPLPDELTHPGADDIWLPIFEP